MSPCGGSGLNTNYGRIASCAGCQLRTPASKSQANPPPAAVLSVLSTRPWPTHLKRICASHMISHTRHSSEPILGTNEYLLCSIHTWHHWRIDIFSCDQAALWMVQSVRPSVCLSVRPSVRPSLTPFWRCFHHRIIMKFSGVVINDKSDVHAKGQGQRSKVKVTEVNSQLSRFRTATPVWIQIRYDEMMHRAWCCLGKVPYCFSRSSVKFQGHAALKIVEFDPNWVFPDCNWSLNTPMATKWCTKLEVE